MKRRLRLMRRVVARNFARQRALALDEAARDIVRAGGDDGVDLRALGDQHPPVERVLEEAVGAPVARHLDEGDHVEKDARPVALGERQVEEVDPRRRLAHHGLQRALQEREAAELDLPQFRDRVGALGVLDPRAPERGRKVGLPRRRPLGLLVHRVDSQTPRPPPAPGRAIGPAKLSQSPRRLQHGSRPCPQATEPHARRAGIDPAAAIPDNRAPNGE